MCLLYGCFTATRLYNGYKLPIHNSTDKHENLKEYSYPPTQTPLEMGKGILKRQDSFEAECSSSIKNDN